MAFALATPAPMAFLRHYVATPQSTAFALAQYALALALLGCAYSQISAGDFGSISSYRHIGVSRIASRLL